MAIGMGVCPCSCWQQLRGRCCRRPALDGGRQPPVRRAHARRRGIHAFSGLTALVQHLLWAALLIEPAMYLHALDPLPPDAPGQTITGRCRGGFRSSARPASSSSACRERSCLGSSVTSARSSSWAHCSASAYSQYGSQPDSLLLPSCTRPAQSRLAGGAQIARGVRQRQVTEGLREVAQLPAGDRIVFLRQ